MAPLQRHQETTIADVGGSSRMPSIDKKTVPLSESIVGSASSSSSSSSSPSPSPSQQETKQNEKNTSLVSHNDDSKKKDADYATKNNGTIDSIMFY
jgi:hypothetical protein